MDYPVDQYIVRGKFFYEKLSAAAQKRAIIFNPTKIIKAERSNLKGKTIVFITVPWDQGPAYIKLDMNSIFDCVISTAQREAAKLIVRVHPREKIADYQTQFDKIIHEKNLNLNIVYDQGSDFNEILKEAAAVIMIVSTVFLDCIKAQVPIIGFDWCDFSFKKRLKDLHVFHFANNLLDLDRLITQALEGRLSGSVENITYFLEENIQEKIPLNGKNDEKILNASTSPVCV